MWVGLEKVFEPDTNPNKNEITFLRGEWCKNDTDSESEQFVILTSKL